MSRLCRFNRKYRGGFVKLFHYEQPKCKLRTLPSNMLFICKVSRQLQINYNAEMKSHLEIDRLIDTPVTERKAVEEYAPELGLVVRQWFGEILTPAEDLALERYLFRCKFPLQ